MAIPDKTIQRIREQVDIVELIGTHVGLKRSGKQFKGLCPFHDEKTPSFYVDPVRGSFKCFGCGAWGDAFDFIQRVEGVSFIAALRSLGARVGVALPDQSPGDVRRAEQRERERELAYRVNACAAEHYRSLLLESGEGEAGRDYQRERAIDDETGEIFRVGYAPAPQEAGWDSLVRELRRRELPLEVGEALGLVARSERTGSYYDRFRGRLMFPIIQPGGRVLGFSGRVLPRFAEGEDGQRAPKYINSPESLLYKKSKTLFGLHAAGSAMREGGRGILVEGQIDVVSMHQRGYRETVAPLGTALTGPQCELLARFTDRMVLCFDGDRAGAKAAYEALPLLLEVGMDVRIAALESGEDPDSTPPERLAGLLRAPGSAIEWFIKRMVAKGARESIEAKGRALRALVPLLRHVRGRDIRGDYANLAAAMLDLPARRIWAAIEGRERDSDGRGRGAGGRSSAQRRSNRRAPQAHGGDGLAGHPGPGPERGAEPVSASPAGSAGSGESGGSQFSAGVPHSAAMRPVPLPSGQASVTALLVDRPELARVAERRGALDQVCDVRLRPIVARVLQAALGGEAMPSEGELLELVDPSQHRLLHARVFGHAYLEIDDPQAALLEGLALCERETLESDLRELERSLALAGQRGDQDELHDLLRRRMAARARLEELARAFTQRGGFSAKRAD